MGADTAEAKHFSYVAHTNTFCQLTNTEITCYAFRAF
ncbi:unnamed protein product [Enterobius vermicularis]|uniref:Ground-like domain-containing protein n=1 Tax=Enterobius vermicularis TaxID=51028 RepID=A0A0N4VQ39_ENTVE|nr:unnamed protein product [Enterobius vermicularis]